MMNDTTKPDSLQAAARMAVDLFDNWFDSIESEVRARAREFIEEMIRGELDTVLARRVTGEARFLAMKKVRSSPATATTAVNGL
jgi:putative transposase